MNSKTTWLWPFLLLGGLAVALRALVWSGLLSFEVMYQADSTTPLYREALAQHFWEYLYYEHSEPIGLSLIHGLLIKLFSKELGLTNIILLLPAMIMGIIATLLTYSTSRRLGAHPLIALPIVALYSIALISLEVWKYGLVFDHYTLVLVAFFAWALVARTQDERLRYDILVAAAGALLISMQKVAYIIVPLMIVATTLLLQQNGRSRLKRMVIALTIPLFFVVLLSGKNFFASGVFAPSSLAGPNVAVFLYAAKGYDYDKVYEFAESAGAPPWYLWCFTQVRDQDSSLGPSYGTCCRSHEKGKKNDGIFNFKPLLTYLKSQDETRLVQIVASDQKRFLERPYLQNFASEMSPHFAIEYSKVSQQLHRALLMREPWTFFKQVIASHKIYLVDGCRFLWIMMKENRWVPFGGVIYLASVASIFLFALAYLVAFWFSGCVLVRSIQGRPHPETDRSKWVLILGILFLSGVFSVVCCENGRWFLQITPYLIPLLASSFTWVFPKPLRQHPK